MSFYIYKIINKKNGYFYIGSTTNINNRKKSHFRSLAAGKHHSLHLQRAYDIYGIDAFEFYVKEVNVNSEKELRLLEERYINFCWNSGKLYNVSKKGCGGDLVSYHPKNQEFRELQSKIMKERYSNLTEEEKTQLSERLKGENNPNYGNKWNEELRNSVSNKLKEYYKTHSSVRKGKTYEEFFGKEKSDELKNKISETRKGKYTGKDNNFFGKHHSEETKKHLSDMRKGKVNLNTAKPVIYNGKTYVSATECAKDLNMSNVTVSYRCRKQIYGFKFVDDNEITRTDNSK